MAFKPVLQQLYSAQSALGADRLEIVLADRCHNAPAAKRFGVGLPGWYIPRGADTAGQVTSRTPALMAKFGVTTIPALVLLDQSGRLLCRYGREWCSADPDGSGFPWRLENKPGPAERAVVNFDLPPARRPTAIQPTLPPSGTPAVCRPNGLPPSFADDCPDTVGSLKRAATTRRIDGGRPPQPTRLNTATPPPVGGLPTVHARTTNRRVRQRHSPPDLPTPDRPPEKPNEVASATQPVRQGKQKSLMQPQPLAAVHPFEPTLQRWQQGIPVDCGPNWTRSVIEAAVARGPHPTARTPDSIVLFAEDIQYQVKAGFC